MEQATIAVILMTYNQERYVWEALEGIRRQVRAPDEVVIADDGSTDGTRRLIIDYVRQYGLEGKWNLLLSPNNRGISQNLRDAIEVVRSRIIVGMAGDDISLPNRCGDVINLFDQYPRCAMIAMSGYVIDQSGKVVGEVNQKDGVFSDVHSAIRYGNPRIFPVGIALRRKIIDDFGPIPVDVPNEDDQITFRGLVSGGIACSSIKAFKYRRHDSSASSWLRRGQSSKEYFERFLQDIGVRERHMRHWVDCLAKAGIANKEVLQALASRKADFYAGLVSVLRSPIWQRLGYIARYYDVLCLKDLVYCLFGRFGVVFWRDLRRAMGRA